QWRINTTTNLWESSTNGTTWTPSAIKATGANGAAGQNGATPEIKTEGGKQYWFINGQNTGVQAYAGDITVVGTDGGYNVVFTDSKGVATDSIFIAKEAVAVSSLTLVPEFTNSNTPIVLFPRIVDGNALNLRNTLLQGSGKIKYNLNPYGVAVANYDATGLLVKESDKVDFRSSGEDVSSKFAAVGSAVKTFGDIVVKYKPTGNPNSWFPTNAAGAKD